MMDNHRKNGVCRVLKLNLILLNSELMRFVQQIGSTSFNTFGQRHTVTIIKSGGNTVFSGLTGSNSFNDVTGIAAPENYYIRASKYGYNLKYSYITYSACNKQSVSIQLGKK